MYEQNGRENLDWFWRYVIFWVDLKSVKYATFYGAWFKLPWILKIFTDSNRKISKSSQNEYLFVDDCLDESGQNELVIHAYRFNPRIWITLTQFQNWSEYFELPGNWNKVSRFLFPEFKPHIWIILQLLMKSPCESSIVDCVCMRVHDQHCMRLSILDTR